VVIPVGGVGASLISIALMGRQPSRGQAPRSKMQLINPCGRAALGAEEPGEPLAEQLLANRLKLCHVLRPGLGRFKVQSRQPIGSAAIGEPELELPEVVVVGGWLVRAAVRVLQAGDTTRRSRWPARQRDTARARSRPRCQRPSVGSAARPSSEERCSAWRDPLAVDADRVDVHVLL
jgi:hypothetical protein